MQEVLALALEARGAIRHYALALCSANLAAQVGLSGLAELALLAFGGAVLVSMRPDIESNTVIDVLESNDIVADLHVGDALTNGLNNTSTFVTEDDGESTLGILARERVGICTRSPSALA